MRWRGSVLLLLLLAPVTALAADPPPASSPALLFDEKFIAEFADPDGELVEINIPAGMLQGLSKGLTAEEPAAARALGGLTGVRALVITVKPELQEAAFSRVRTLSEELVAKGYQPIARVRDKESTVTVLSGRTVPGGKIEGLVVLVFDRSDRELVFCEIGGVFDLAQLGAITDQLDLPGLDEVEDGTER